MEKKLKAIETSEITKYAKQKNLEFYQTSANTGDNVNRVIYF